MDEDVERLADVLHGEQCNDLPDCGRWRRTTSDHRHYYQAQARAIIEQLEPEIGIANVFTAVRVILGVTS